MKKITLIYLLLLGFLFSCPSSSPGDVHGILILENQSNYDISIEFYGGKNNFLTDSISLDKNSGTWQKHYEEEGSLNMLTIFINQHADSVFSVDSIRVIYDNQRLRIHEPGFTTEDQQRDFEELINTKRNLHMYESYAVKRERTSIGCKTNEENYRYIFTNADYEVAKPITP